MWIKELGEAWEGLPDAQLLLPPSLVAILSRLMEATSEAGAIMLSVESGPCSILCLKQLEIGGYYQIVSFWLVAQGI